MKKHRKKRTLYFDGQFLYCIDYYRMETRVKSPTSHSDIGASRLNPLKVLSGMPSPQLRSWGAGCGAGWGAGCGAGCAAGCGAGCGAGRGAGLAARILFSSSISRQTGRSWGEGWLALECVQHLAKGRQLAQLSLRRRRQQPPRPPQRRSRPRLALLSRRRRPPARRVRRPAESMLPRSLPPMPRMTVAALAEAAVRAR